MVDQKKAIKDILFTVSVISIMGTVGGLEVGSLSITEGVMYLLISWITLLYSEMQPFEIRPVLWEMRL